MGLPLASAGAVGFGASGDDPANVRPCARADPAGRFADVKREGMRR